MLNGNLEMILRLRIMGFWGMWGEVRTRSEKDGRRCDDWGLGIVGFGWKREKEEDSWGIMDLMGRDGHVRLLNINDEFLAYGARLASGWHRGLGLFEGTRKDAIAGIRRRGRPKRTRVCQNTPKYF